MRTLFLLWLALFSVAACSHQDTPHTTAANWIGQWTGPEDTSLKIQQNGEGIYRVTITDLDGPRGFAGTSAPGGIAIARDSEKLTIRHGSGADTGMKWLADKRDCLIVAPHEGYCRD